MSEPARLAEIMSNRNQQKAKVPDYYALAKRAEYGDQDQPRNLDKAISLYQKAIQYDQKVDSAIKDMAALLHQKGQTAEACAFLLKMRPKIKGDLKKYDNLHLNLTKQLVPSGKFLCKSLLVIDREQQSVRRLFLNDQRIESVEYYSSINLDQQSPSGHFALVNFASYSSAKKTLETLDPGYRGEVFWVNVNRLVTALAYPKDLNFHTFYHGDSTWSWMATLPENERKQPCPFRWGEDEPLPESARRIREEQNRCKMEKILAKLN